MIKLKAILNENEIDNLKNRAVELNKKAFINRDELRELEDIKRTLKNKYNVDIDSDYWNMNRDRTKKYKFKKTKRVTNFNRNRS